MKPEIGGKHSWIFLHAIALSYPINPSEKKQKYMKSLIISLQEVLPCELCCEHYSQNINNIDLVEVVRNQENLSKFFIDIHNSVNKQNKKKVLSYEEAKQEIQYLYKKPDPLNLIWLLIVIIILLLIGSYYFYNQYNTCRNLKKNLKNNCNSKEFN